MDRKRKIDTIVRLEPVVRALARMEGPEGVRSVLEEHNVTKDDFLHLDEKPGWWGYQHEGQGWHWKLRQFRNNFDNFESWWRSA